MNKEFELLAEKDALWAQVLVQVLKENSIPCMALPVHGAGLVMRTGIQERMQVFVPAVHLLRARELMQDLFSDADEQT